MTLQSTSREKARADRLPACSGRRLPRLRLCRRASHLFDIGAGRRGDCQRSFGDLAHDFLHADRGRDRLRQRPQDLGVARVDRECLGRLISRDDAQERGDEATVLVIIQLAEGCVDEKTAARRMMAATLVREPVTPFGSVFGSTRSADARRARVRHIQMHAHQKHDERGSTGVVDDQIGSGADNMTAPNVSVASLEAISNTGDRGLMSSECRATLRTRSPAHIPRRTFPSMRRRSFRSRATPRDASNSNAWFFSHIALWDEHARSTKTFSWIRDPRRVRARNQARLHDVRELYEDLGSKEKVFVDLACSSHNAMWEKNHALLFEASREWLESGTIGGASTGMIRRGY